MSSAEVATTAAQSTPAAAADDEGYIQTTTLNYVSRKAIIDNAKQLEIKGRTVLEAGIRIRADLHWIRIGRYCHIQSGSCLEPSVLVVSTNSNNNSNDEEGSTIKYVPLQIGSHTVIGTNSMIQAASIGSYCWIGNNVTIGPRCIIKDNCVIASNTIVPADTVIPPFTRVEQNHNHNNKMMKKRFQRLIMTELPPAVSVQLQEQTMEFFNEFSSIQRQLQLRKPKK